MIGSDHFAALASADFEAGYPTEATSRTLSEELYFQRAVQCYLWALPAVNMFAMKKGLGEVSGAGYHVMSVFERRLKPKTHITTPNSDVIYNLGFADLSRSGPLVLEAPAKIQGLLDDFWHRPLTGPVIDGIQYRGDIGIPGPDRGAGGKYLIVPEGYDLSAVADADEYFLFISKTNGVFIFLRGFFTSVDDLVPGVSAVEGITIRPLNGQARPMAFRHVSDIPANALFPADGAYFDMLDELIQGERIDAVDPYMHGMLAALGIAKGADFSPPTASENCWIWAPERHGRWPRTSLRTTTMRKTGCGGRTGIGWRTPRPNSTTSGTPCSMSGGATARPDTPM